MFAALKIRRIIIDLFFAGTESTTSALTFALLYLITHPQVQHRCQQEIDDVVGAGRLPCLNDRVNMPYVEATLHEVMRMANVGECHFTKQGKVNGTPFHLKFQTIIRELLPWQSSKSVRIEMLVGPIGI